MATSLTDALYVDFLKEWYRGTRVAILTYTNHPFLGVIPKNTNVRGEVYPKPIQYANIAGRSAVYSDADSNRFPAQRERWECSHIDNYAKASVTNKVMALSQGNDAAFREALTSAFDSAYNAFANDQHFELFGDGSGIRGTIASVAGAPTYTLGSGEARFFEVNMVLEARDSAGALRAGGPYTVVAVDRVNDSVTLGASITAGAATDTLNQVGDYNAKAQGAEAWLVETTDLVSGGGTVADVLNGVDRSADPTRLAGVDGITGTATGLEITDSLIKTGARLYREGGSPNVALLHPEDVATLAQETEQRGRYMKVQSTEASISFSALEIMTGAGAVPVVADPAQTPNRAYMLDTGTWELFSAGPAPSMFDKDGSKIHRTETADEVQFYLYGYYNVVCQNPGGNARISALV